MKHHKHALHYIDLHPEAIKTREPSAWAVIGGAFVAVCALYLVTVFLFSL